MLNLDNKSFKSQSNSDNGEVSAETIFHYRQTGDVISADYQGGDIIKGHLVGKVIEGKHLEFVYHHINKNMELMTGKCISYPEINPEGKLVLKEYWQWTCKDNSAGESRIVEL
ncbi:MAG: n-acetylglutamate synthase [Saprospiraceae bacterium]|nr:n-acetylglutamate synthase [Saprospiraceae bacterium]